VFTARYALSPYIKQIRFVFKGLKLCYFSKGLLDWLYTWTRGRLFWRIWRTAKAVWQRERNVTSVWERGRREAVREKPRKEKDEEEAGVGLPKEMLPLVWTYIYSSKTIDESRIRENPVKAGTARDCGSEVYSIASPLHPAGARKSVHPWSRDGPAFYDLPSVPRADIKHHPRRYRRRDFFRVGSGDQVIGVPNIRLHKRDKWKPAAPPTVYVGHPRVGYRMWFTVY
jgi:hypothetical protein